MRESGCCCACACLFLMLWGTFASAIPVRVGGLQCPSPIFDPVTGHYFHAMRTDIATTFAGSTFTSLPDLTGDLTGYDLIVACGFNDPGLTAAEQINLANFVTGGGHYFYVGEGMVTPDNTSFVAPVGMAMVPDPSTDEALLFAPWTNPTHPFLNGPFGQATTPPNSVSGSVAAMVTTLGPATELARWSPSAGAGGIAVAAVERNVLAPGAGFVLVSTDVNMIGARWDTELGIPFMNALYQAVPEPAGASSLLLLAMIHACRSTTRSTTRQRRNR
jgi:hypothetical protein